MMNGKEVPKENYTAYEGSTVVVLKADYVKSLEVGEYDIAFIFTDGIARGKLTVTPKSTANEGKKDEGKADSKTSDKPSKDDKKQDSSKQETKPSESGTEKAVKTGDDQNFIGYLILLLAAGTLAAALRKRERK